MFSVVPSGQPGPWGPLCTSTCWHLHHNQPAAATTFRTSPWNPTRAGPGAGWGWRPTWPPAVTHRWRPGLRLPVRLSTLSWSLLSLQLLPVPPHPPPCRQLGWAVGVNFHWEGGAVPSVAESWGGSRKPCGGRAGERQWVSLGSSSLCPFCEAKQVGAPRAGWPPG